MVEIDKRMQLHRAFSYKSKLDNEFEIERN